MKFSIITINYNNAEGLRKTLASVAGQTFRNVEHVIVDGGSTDGSVDVIKEYVNKVERMNELAVEKINVVWSSEKDRGIYNAMNKGISKATGDYVWILNSGDCVAASDTVECMMAVLQHINEERLRENKDRVPILMGNILHSYSDGHKVRETKQKVAKGLLSQTAKQLSPRLIDASMFSFYRGTIPHDAAFVRRDLFEKYGLFDDTMKICADWKLYLNMIALGDVVPMYVNIDVVLFDMTGISNANEELRFKERRAYLEEILPPSVLKDYDRYGDDIVLMQRLHRHPWAFYLTRFLERVLFKIEKWSRK